MLYSSIHIWGKTRLLFVDAQGFRTNCVPFCPVVASNRESYYSRLSLTNAESPRLLA